MQLRLQPIIPHGSIRAVSSKSYLHRMLICAAFSASPCSIHYYGTLGEDIAATAHALCALGASIARNEQTITVTPLQTPANNAVLHCAQSASTARFLLPVVAAVCDTATLTGSGSLPSRELAPLCEALQNNGATLSAHHLPLTCTGRLTSGDFLVPGGHTSQYATGLWLCSALLPGGGRVRVTDTLVSQPYLALTRHVMQQFGATVSGTLQDAFISVPQGEFCAPQEMRCPGDWSCAAAFLCMAAIGGDVCLAGLQKDSLQADSVLTDILQKMGASVSLQADAVCVRGAVHLPITQDVSSCPDLLPVLCALCCAVEGESILTGVGRLRGKESDRVQSSCAVLGALGADITAQGDAIYIRGAKPLRGGEVDSFGDHRIAMMTAVAACLCSAPVVLKNAQAVHKSYPGFWDDLEKIGGNWDVL